MNVKMNAGFAPDETDIASFPQLDEREMQLLWSVAWWDGPLSGLLEYRGQKCWFHFHHEDETDCGRGGCSHYHYILYAVTQDQILEAETWLNSLGRWDSEMGKYLARDEAVHDESWNCPDRSVAKPIGWFKDGLNANFYGIKVDK